MAKEPTPAYEPDRLYEVTLSRPVARKGRILSPMHRHALKGRIVAELPPEAVANVQPL